jgi:hypothetical protein
MDRGRDDITLGRTMEDRSARKNGEPWAWPRYAHTTVRLIDRLWIARGERLYKAGARYAAPNLSAG